MLTNRSMPAATVIPELPCDDLRATAEWLSRAFGFSPRLWIGDHRVQLQIGDGVIVLVKRALSGEVRLMVRVEDADRHFAQARAAGAEIVSEPATHPYGERQYTCRDLAGRLWTFSQSVADVDPASWGGELGNFPNGRA